MSDSKIVQLRRVGGLKNIKDSKGNPIQAKLYKQLNKNRNEEGELIGDYKGVTFLDSRDYICPMWDNDHWCWASTPEKLAELIVKCNLRYPPGHRMEDQLITINPPERSARERLNFRMDDFFRHPAFYGKFFLQDGRINFDLSDPIQEVLYWCYLGNSQTRDKSSDKIINHYLAGNIKYEMISPKAETAKKKVTVVKEIEAFKLLAALEGDEARLRGIAEVMGIPGYSSKSDVDGVFILLRDMGAQNTETSAKFGGKTYQERFIELAKMLPEDLDVNRNVIKGKNLAIIRFRNNQLLLNGEKVAEGSGYISDVKVIDFFRNDDNQHHYIELLDVIEKSKK